MARWQRAQRSRDACCERKRSIHREEARRREPPYLFVAGTAGSLALGAAAQQSESITVSAAISLKDALDELGPIFQVQRHRKNGGSGTAVTYNYGGSGTLARQIEQGAPVDVFFSAAEKQMDELSAQTLDRGGYSARSGGQCAGIDCSGAVDAAAQFSGSHRIRSENDSAG